MKKIISLILSVLILCCFTPAYIFANTDIDINTVTISTVDNQLYTGKEIKPNIVVKSGETELSENVDYTIVYANNINAGTATITINGIAGKFSGSKTITFDIKKTIKNTVIESLNTIPEGQTVQDLKIKDGNYILVKDTDYTINAQPTVSGQNVVTVVGKGNYTGIGSSPDSVEFRYLGGTDIEKEFSMVIPTSSVQYTGKEIPLTGVYLKDKKGSDLDSRYYSISYENNLNVGMARVIATGIYPYAGKIVGTFNITARNLNTYCVMSKIENVVKGDKPAVIIKDGSNILKENIDYILTDTQSNTSGIVTATGINNYSGYINGSYKIAPSLKNAVVALDNNTYIYDGTPKTPALKAYFYNYVLVKDKDYKLEYTDNINTGTATVKVIGINDYAGVVEKTFKIDPINLSNAKVILSTENSPYTGSEIKPSASVYYNGRYISSNDYSVSYWNNINVGTATVYIYPKYNEQTKSTNTVGGITKTFLIGGKYISSASVTLNSYTYYYDGFEKRPVVAIRDGNNTLRLGIDFTVAYQNNIKAGIGSVIITGKGIYSGTTSVSFTIRGLNQTVSTRYTDYTKYLTSSSFNLDASANGDGNGFTYRSSDESVVKVSPLGTVEIVGTGIATITVATTGTTKYDPASKTVTVTVKPNKAVISRAYSPASGKLKVAIKKAPGVTKYQVKYGRNGSYKNFYYKYSTNPNYITQAKTFKGLDNGKAYFVKVRGYKTMSDGTKVWGNWSKTRKVYVK